MEDRIQKARDLHLNGYNCAQAVFLAYSDLFGMDDRFAATLSAPLGGGLGRMREVCGTVTAMSLLAGQLEPAYDPADKEAKARNFALVKECAEKFRSRHGAIVCRDLLELLKTRKALENVSATDAGITRQKPCNEYVATAARIIGEKLQEIPK